MAPAVLSQESRPDIFGSRLVLGKKQPYACNMPQFQTKYSVLLSSPSDLVDERAMVAEVIAELNQTWGAPNSAVIALLSWESCVAPSFGSEAQDVVNRGLGTDWDIYLGLMHARF